MFVEIRGLCYVDPASHWPSDSWPFPLLNADTGELSRSLGKDDLTPYFGHNTSHLGSILELILLSRMQVIQP